MLNMIENIQSKTKGREREREREREKNRLGLNGLKIKSFNNHQSA